jgi:hypothetical protein
MIKWFANALSYQLGVRYLLEPLPRLTIELLVKRIYCSSCSTVGRLPVEPLRTTVGNSRSLNEYSDVPGTPRLRVLLLRALGRHNSEYSGTHC